MVLLVGQHAQIATVAFWLQRQGAACKRVLEVAQVHAHKTSNLLSARKV